MIKNCRPGVDVGGFKKKLLTPFNSSLILVRASKPALNVLAISINRPAEIFTRQVVFLLHAYAETALV